MQDKEISDIYLMGEQALLYNIIRNFLDTNEAREFNITGINVEIQDGYVNAEWKFGNRVENDIKNEL